MKDRNKSAHRDFLATFQKLADRFTAEGDTTAILLDLRGLVADWLTRHICHVDTNLRGCASDGPGHSHGHGRRLAAALGDRNGLKPQLAGQK